MACLEPDTRTLAHVPPRSTAQQRRGAEKGQGERDRQDQPVGDRLSLHMADLDRLISRKKVGITLRRFSDQDPVVLKAGEDLYTGGNNFSEALNVFCNAHQRVGPPSRRVRS